MDFNLKGKGLIEPLKEIALAHSYLNHFSQKLRLPLGWWSFCGSACEEVALPPQLLLANPAFFLWGNISLIYQIPFPKTQTLEQQ
jgi:hypothetical protein